MVNRNVCFCSGCNTSVIIIIKPHKIVAGKRAHDNKRRGFGVRNCHFSRLESVCLKSLQDFFSFYTPTFMYI